MEFDKVKLKPTYKILWGVPGYRIITSIYLMSEVLMSLLIWFFQALVITAVSLHWILLTFLSIKREIPFCSNEFGWICLKLFCTTLFCDSDFSFTASIGNISQLGVLFHVLTEWLNWVILNFSKFWTLFFVPYILVVCNANKDWFEQAKTG